MKLTVGLGAALGILSVHAFMDIRTRRINLIVTGFCLAAGVIWQITWEKSEVWEILLSCLPGILLLAAAYLTEQKIGSGDGWVVTAAGVWTGFEDIFLILTVGMLACAVCSGTLLVLKKVRRRDALPFIPFLVIGWIGRMFLM
ncbi:MAG TPA: prepilin peptidase [Candidatus Fusicatenibacter merdavium]|uniref:Prepilin peptidase n=1 Tax=Candidatus Fusicatenibacter merdavium TaxID=2838600 RepID=A0A9D1XEC6_9FIRM|nr:prepilin peptidase [Candidatus Fusicatenibacter merdavium]